MRDARLDVVELRAESVTTIGAGDSVEVGGIAQLQGDRHLYRAVARPRLEVAQVHPVVEDPGDKGVLGDLSGDLRRHRAHPRDLAVLTTLAYVGPAPLGQLVTDQHDQLGTGGAALAVAGKQGREGVG